MTPEANRSPAEGLRRPRSIGTVLTALILLAGSSLSALFYLHNREWSEAQLREAVFHDVVGIGGKVKHRIDSYKLGLSALQEIYRCGPEDTPAKFTNLVGTTFPSPDNFQPQAAVAMVDRKTGGRMVTRYCYGASNLGVGQDEPLADTAIGRAIEAAITSGGGNDEIRLVPDLKRPDGTSLSLLVVAQSVDSARTQWLVGAFSFEELLRTSIDNTTTLSYDVFAVSEVNPGETKVLYFDAASFPEHHEIANPTAFHEHSATQSYVLLINNQRVRLAFSPTPDWMRKNDSPLPNVVLALGLGITGLLAALFVYKSRRADTVEGLVLERTAELAMANLRLDESRNALASLLEACPDAIIGKDANGRWTFANRAFLDLAGVPENFPYRGLRDAEVIQRSHPTNGDLVELQGKLDAEVLRTGQALRREATLEFTNGSKRYLDIHMLPVRSNEGGVSGVVAVHNDITELRRRIIALQRSRERVKLLVENTATAIIEWDDRLRAINWNPAAARLFGYEWEEVQQQPASLFADPDDRESSTRALESCLKERREIIPQIFRHRTRRGEIVLCEWQNTPLIDEDGRTLGVTSFIYDVTERTKAEQSLRKRDRILRGLAGSAAGFLNADTWEPEANELLRNLVESLTLSRVLLVRTPKPEEGGGAVTMLEWINPAWNGRPILPPPDAPPDRDPHYLLMRTGLDEVLSTRGEHVGSVDRFPEALRMVFDQQGVRSMLVEPIIIRGYRWGFLRFDDCQTGRDWSADEIDALRIVAGVLAGAIARQVLTKERLGMEKRLLLSQKRESLGMLAGGIARDFNNLVNSILGSASLGRAMADSDSSIDQCLASIEENGLRAAALCRQMLAYAGHSESQAGLASPNLVVLDVINAIDPEQHRRILFRKDLANGIPVVEGDIEQLRQALHAVVVNAIEAIGANAGLIEIRTRALSRGNEASPEHVQFTVRDTGCGMDVRVRDRIFDPFFSTKMTGRGLGLTVAQSIVEAHGGQITAESEPAAGTTFQIVIPCRRPQPKTAPTSPRGEGSGLSGMVLVVHQGRPLAQATCLAFQQLGFQSEDCPTIEDALRLLHSHPGRYRLVAVDPTVPGAEPPTLNRLRQAANNTSVILLASPRECPAALRNFADEGLAIMLRDDISIESLRGAVQEAMDGGHM